jgi:hypothetical protein
MSDAHQADTAHLEQTGKRRSGAREQSPVCGFEMNAVVSNKSGEWQQGGTCRLD